MSEKKVAGLWIDQTKAVVVKNHNDFEVTDWNVSDTLKAEIQHGNSNENAANNAEKTNRVKFYKEIEKAITNSVDLYVTGPGIAQEELRNYLLETPQYKNLNITLGTSTDSNPDVVLNEVMSHYNA